MRFIIFLCVSQTLCLLLSSGRWSSYVKSVLHLYIKCKHYVIQGLDVIMMLYSCSRKFRKIYFSKKNWKLFVQLKFWLLHLVYVLSSISSIITLKNYKNNKERTRKHLITIHLWNLVSFQHNHTPSLCTVYQFIHRYIK